MINFIPSEEQLKARALWIYYHTVTEHFDRNLRHTIPSPSGDGTVIAIKGSAFYSNQFAGKTYELIRTISNYYGIEYREFEVARLDVCRLKHNHIESLYKDMDENEEFEFIDDYISLEKEKRDLEQSTVRTIPKW